MEWFNDNSGILVLIFGILLVVGVGFALYALLDMRRKIAVQKLKFLGFYSSDAETHENYAKIIIGNKSINNIGIAELGLCNGKVNFDLTQLYRDKKGLPSDARIVIEQRNSIGFELTQDELLRVVITGEKGKKILNKLYCYAVDFTGNLYKCKVSVVRKLLVEIMKKQG